MKNAIVLGASGGLGKEIAKELVSNGYHVFGTYMRNKPTLADTEKVTFLKLDIEDKKSIEKFIIFTGFVRRTYLQSSASFFSFSDRSLPAR